MIKAVTIINYIGESIVLDLMSPEKSGLIVTSIDGLGPSKGNVNVTNLASNDGSIYNSARLDSRNIVLKLRYMPKPTIEATRQLTYKYFPVKKPLTMIIETDRRTASCYGYVESNEVNIFDKEESSQISIICPDPYFYSAGENGTKVTKFSDLFPTFSFPFSNDSLTEKELQFGDIKNYREQNVYYDGDSEIGLIMEIHAYGSIDGTITIYNVITRESMVVDVDKIEKITGSKLIAGDTITISTLRGNKKISLLRMGKTFNILNAIGKNTNWFQLRKGDNVFTYVSTAGSSNIQFKITNQILYEGV